MMSVYNSLCEVVPNRILIQMIDTYEIKIKFRLMRGQNLNFIYHSIVDCLIGKYHIKIL